jgi:catechol 2,3-dioxygenase-like lactoylglutathione lyase family enzyme
MKVNRIDHVAMVVRDLDVAVARFTTQFGLALLSHGLAADGALRMAYLGAAGTSLQLISPVGPGPFADFLEQRGEGLHHVCFEVGSVDDSRLPGDLAFRPSTVGGMGATVRFLAEPVHGAMIELTEPPRGGAA